MKYSALISGVFISMTAMAQQQGAFKGVYPETKKLEVTEVYFGTSVTDPYRWLENDMAEDTKDWVQRQNAVKQEYLQPIPLRDAIKKRLTQLWNYEKYSAPFKEGAYTYFFKNDGLQNQSVLYRQQDNGNPEVFLDPNKLTADGTTSLSGLEFTKDGSLCAYTVSPGGSDGSKLLVMDAVTKQLLDDTL